MSHKTPGQRAGRNRAATAMLLGLLAAIGGVVGGPARPAYAQTTPNSDLNSYVLFAVEELDFKGGQGNHGPSIIDGGNIGVNDAGFIRGNDFRLNLCANAQMIMSDGTMVVGDTTRLGDSSTPTQECDVDEAFINTGAPNNEEPRSGPAMTYLPPVIRSAPPLPDFNCNPNNDLTVPAQGTATMTPAVEYGDVQWQNGTTITLPAGTYTMCRITTGQNVTVITEPGVVLQVVDDFLINDNMHFDGPDCDTIPVVYVEARGVDQNSNAVRFGQDSEIWGHFYTPDGRLNLGNQTSLHGTFWARAIGSDFNVDVEYCPPPLPQPPTGTISVTKRITGDTAGTPPDASFTIHYECEIPAPGIDESLTGSFDIAAGETVTFTDVEVGTTCTANEVDTPDPLPGYVFDPPIIDPETVIVEEEGQTVEVVVENPLREIFGTLEVTKSVSGDTDGVSPGSQFGFDLDCTDDTFDTTFSLEPGETFTSDPIRVGVSCTVAETDVPDPLANFQYQDPVFTPDPPTVTIAAENQTVTVAVDNPLVEFVGQFRVRKQVTGDTDGYVQGTEFGFALDCDDDAFDTTFQLADGEVFTSVEMPVGTTCTVLESTIPDPAAGFSYADPVFTPDPPTVTLTRPHQIVEMKAANELVGPTPPTKPPKPPQHSTPPASPTDLPATGGASLWLAAASLAAGLVGSGLLATRRRRGRHQ